MNTVLKITLLLIAVFSSSFGIACMLKLAKNYLEEFYCLKFKNKKDERNVSDDRQQSNPKIYYIRDYAKKTKPKRKPRKKTDMAFKSIVVYPEEFHKR